MAKWPEAYFTRNDVKKSMAAKVKWSDIYKEFRMKHPRLKKEVMDYRPYDFMTIILTFEDGTKMTYNGMTKECKFLV